MDRDMDRDMDGGVVVAGGGPVGLMTACELALAGVRVVVLDRLLEPSAHDRAGVLHTRTVETLDARGLLERFREGHDETDGLPFAGIFTEGLLYEGLRTRHQYSLMVPQSATERILGERADELGVEVRRGHEVTGLRQDDDEVAVDVRGPDGGYRLRASYLVGCDGGRSTVRGLAGIPFDGRDATVRAVIGYVTCHEQNLPMMWERAKNGIIILGFPPEGGMGRVVAIEYNRPHVDRGEPVTLAEMNEAVLRVTGRAVPLTEPVLWMSRFSDTSRQARRYRDGRVFLAGDAAHVHFPVGGQGLNTGLQDAVNLGWKLAGRVDGWAPDALLDTYHEERHPVAQRVQMNTRAQLALMNPDEQHVTPLRSLFEELLGIEQVNRHLMEMITGLDIRHPGEHTHPLAGRFAPDLTVKTADGPVRLARSLATGRGVLLDLGGRDDLCALARNWHRRVDVLAGRTEEQPPPTAAVLVRPDGYCAWATDAAPSDEDREGLRQELTRWFGSDRDG